MQEITPAVVQMTGSIVSVSEELIKSIITRATLAPERRARALIHPNVDDSLHEMLIALPRESCDIPHINFKSGKSFHVVEGEMALMAFSPDGMEVTAYQLSGLSKSHARMARLIDPCWHTIIPLSDYVVFVETNIGPFTGNQFAPWCPDKGTAAWQEFVNQLRDIAAPRTVATKAKISYSSLARVDS